MPPKIISVITAAAPNRGSTILGAYESLAAQVLPAGWEWEWLVQEDGSDQQIRSMLPNDRRIHYWWNGLQGGTAQTRNFALTRANGEIVRNLDDDDSLTEGALAQDIGTLASDTSLAWTCSRAVDIHPDGSVHTFPEVIDSGRVLPGTLFQYWKLSNGLVPVHPATLAIRRNILRAFGGWMAIPVSDDVGMLMAVSSVFTGYYAEDISMRYRKSDFQITAQHYAKSEHTRSQRFRAIEQRVESVLDVFRSIAN